MPANPVLEARLQALQSDFESVAGAPFETFYCPMTFRDEHVELCRGHILPKAFPDSARSWTVQRKDIDGFFGTTLEAEYVTLRHKGIRRAAEGLVDPGLARELQPKVRLRGKEVEFYRPKGTVPSHHTPVVVDCSHGPIQLVLKMSPSEILAAEGRDWELGFERDLRVPVLATALKSAHLTLFHLVGYRYVLSAAGHFVGWDVLGSFFSAQAGKSRAEARAAAHEHFKPYVNMVRPLLRFPDSLQGTLSDRKLYLCKTDAWPWAILLFVRTGKFMHSVVLPCFDQDHAVARYLRFLDGNDRSFTAYLTEFDGDQWKVSTEGKLFEWPESRFEDDFMIPAD